MGGMFTILKVRKELAGDGDPAVIDHLRAQIEGMGELSYPISTAIYRVQRQGRRFEALE